MDESSKPEQESAVELTPAEQEDQLKYQIAGEIVKELSQRPEFLERLAVLIGARQLVALVNFELTGALSALSKEDRIKLVSNARAAVNGDEVVLDDSDIFSRANFLLREIAASKSSEQFDVSHFAQGFRQTLSPWVTRTVKKLMRELEAQRKREHEAAKQKLKETPIPLGVVFHPEHGSLLSRDRVLVLTGPRDLVARVLDTIVENMTTDSENLITTVRFTDANGIWGDSPSNSRLVPVLKHQWSNCGKSTNSILRFFSTQVLPRLSDPMDVLVVDDMRDVVSIGNRSLFYRLDTAHKRLRGFCRLFVSGLIIGFPWDDPREAELVSLISGIRAFSTIVPVSLKSANDDFLEISLGDASTIQVPVDKTQGVASKLIVP